MGEREGRCEVWGYVEGAAGVGEEGGAVGECPVGRAIEVEDAEGGVCGWCSD